MSRYAYLQRAEFRAYRQYEKIKEEWINTLNEYDVFMEEPEVVKMANKAHEKAFWEFEEYKAKQNGTYNDLFLVKKSFYSMDISEKERMELLVAEGVTSHEYILKHQYELMEMLI